MEFMLAGGYVFFMVFTLIALASGAFWIWTLVDVVRRTDYEFALIGQSKIMWILLIVLGGIVGSVLYVAIARPKFGPAGYAR